MSAGIMIDNKEGIEFFRLLALRGALKLMTVGIKTRNANPIKVAQSYGFKGRTAKALLPQVEEYIEKYKAENDQKLKEGINQIN